MLLAPQAWDSTQRTLAVKAMAKHGVGDTRYDCGRVVLSPATNEVVSVVAIDGRTPLVVWGAAALALDVFLAERDSLWVPFHDSTITVLALATVRSVKLVQWRLQHPDIHVYSSPSAKQHLLISATPVDVWRCRPHIVIEAAITMLGDYPKPISWVRTVAWVCADDRIRFEPPVARWRYSSAWNGMHDRSLVVRRASGRNDELLYARIDKIPQRADFHASVGISRNSASVEAIQRIGDWRLAIGDWRIPADWAILGRSRESVAIVRFISLIEQEASCAATVIQRAWRMAVSNPAFVVCRRRLLTEFAAELTTKPRTHV